MRIPKFFLRPLSQQGEGSVWEDEAGETHNKPSNTYEELAMKKIVLSLLVVLSLSFIPMQLAEAGRRDGPGLDTTICEAFGSVTYHENFFGGEEARVAIVGDGS